MQRSTRPPWNRALPTPDPPIFPVAKRVHSLFDTLVTYKAVFGLTKPKNPDEHRYYLLPGMGKANRRKHRAYLKWALVVGFFISGIIALILYLSQRPGPGIFGP